MALCSTCKEICFVKSATEMHILHTIHIIVTTTENIIVQMNV